MHSSSRHEDVHNHPTLHLQIFGRSEGSFGSPSEDSVECLNRSESESSDCPRRHAAARGYELRGRRNPMSCLPSLTIFIFQPWRGGKVVCVMSHETSSASDKMFG